MNGAEPWFLPLTLCALLGCALMAGVFFAFSAFVLRGLAVLPPERGIAAMQSVNAAALTPLFLAAFVGTALLCALSGGASALLAAGQQRWLPAAGALLYLLGTFLVTAAGNVPLNNALASLDPARPESAAEWSRYRARWSACNHVRTVTSLAATACFAFALGPGA